MYQKLNLGWDGVWSIGFFLLCVRLHVYTPIADFFWNHMLFLVLLTSWEIAPLGVAAPIMKMGLNLDLALLALSFPST